MDSVRLPSYDALGKLLSTREAGVTLKMLRNGPVGKGVDSWIIGRPNFTFGLRAL